MPTTRVTLTLKEKLDLLDKLKKSGLFVRKYYASQNAVHSAVLNRIKNSEDSLKVQIERKTVRGSRERMRESFMPGVDEAILRCH